MHNFLRDATAVGTLLFLLTVSAGESISSRLQVRLATDEADAVLAILAKEDSGLPVKDADWERLFASEGYQRLKRRETELKRLFDDSEFRKFVLSPQLRTRRSALQNTLEEWKHSELTRPAELAFAYLPDTATIKATVYPVIKPKPNSFVFEVSTDPAIFLYLDPEVDQKEFENTVAHEFHHIGYGTGCPPKEVQNEIAKQSSAVQQLIRWTGAFGEGFAMLAAAGGPDVNPHAASKAEDRKRWDHDVSEFNKNQQELDQFFRDILSGKLNQEQVRDRGFSYFGVQGPWYTVGWKMAVTVERVDGRKRLIQAICDYPGFLSTYNAAARKLSQKGGENLPLWSPAIINALNLLSGK